MLTGAQVQELVERMLKSSGRRIDISRPFVDAVLPEGHRLHVVLEGISRGWTAVNIRKCARMRVRASDLHRRDYGVTSVREESATAEPSTASTAARVRSSESGQR